MGLRFLTAGESHGPELTAVLDGLPAGLPLGQADIDRHLARRQAGYGAGPRMKMERDQARLTGGVMEGVTTGAPLAFCIANRDHAHWRGKAVEPFTIPRPGHADLSGALKYRFDDLRPALERASARETAARVAVGAACLRFLEELGVQVGGYVVQIGAVQAQRLPQDLPARIAAAEAGDVRCPDPDAAEEMHRAIRQAMAERDTLGGVIEVAAWGLPPGLGSYTQWDRRLEARIGAALLSVQAIKGVEFGRAFEIAGLPGTQAHDAIQIDRAAPGDSRLARPTNRAGGVEGGVTNGLPIIVRAAMKPIATTLTPQASVDMASGRPTETHYERSDFCPVPRAVPILEAMLAFVLADALLEKVGGDSMAEVRPRMQGLTQARLEDLHISGRAHIFWPGNPTEQP